LNVLVCGWPARPRLGAEALSNARMRCCCRLRSAAAAADPQRVRTATVDHFGEQTVQVAVTAVTAAIVLLLAMLFMLLAVRIATLAMPKPMLARVPLRTGRLVLPETSQIPWDLGLKTSLPTRGPPGGSLLPSPLRYIFAPIATRPTV